MSMECMLIITSPGTVYTNLGRWFITYIIMYYFCYSAISKAYQAHLQVRALSVCTISSPIKETVVFILNSELS